VRAGVGGAPVVAAGAADAGAGADEAPLGPPDVAPLAWAGDGAKVDVSATSQAAQSAAASTQAATSFSMRPR